MTIQLARSSYFSRSIPLLAVLFCVTLNCGGCAKSEAPPPASYATPPAAAAPEAVPKQPYGSDSGSGPSTDNPASAAGPAPKTEKDGSAPNVPSSGKPPDKNPGL